MSAEEAVGPGLDEHLVRSEHPLADGGDSRVFDGASGTPIVEVDIGELSGEDPNGSRDSEGGTVRSIVEWTAVIGVAILAALIIKTFAFEAFEIPTGSMQPAVNSGDRILVNKLSYRLGSVERGDLVVFERLEDSVSDTDDLIKRVVALPGETIELRDDGRIYIWGPGETARDALLLSEPYLDPINVQLAQPRSDSSPAGNFWDETCVNPREIARCTLDSSSYFVLGDNRFASSDSRVFGPVPEEKLVGRAFARIWPLSGLGAL